MFVGTTMGILAGSVAGVLLIKIKAALQETSPTISVILSWTIAFAFIGFGTGLRWVGSNRNRASHALMGGLIGGAFGGIVFASQFGGDPDVAKAMGLMLAGVGIAGGVTVAPVILRNGVVRLVNSGSAAVRNRQINMEWELNEGGQYLIGNLNPRNSRSSMRSEVDIFILDEMVAERHAYIVSHRKRFYIEPHAEIKTVEGLPRLPLKVGTRDVSRPEELKDGDMITVGLTLLRFEARRKQG
jgi:hypothetical protein